MIRVLIAKPGLDGHDRGAKVVASALRDAGMEVIYTGLHQSPEEIAIAALQEDVDVIGLSILSGAHRSVCRKIMRLLAMHKLTSVQVMVGGIIPQGEIAYLKRLGVAAIFHPGTPLKEIIEFVRQSSGTSRTRTRGS
jgi:methylmalonyl-CoA mutase C-terminal domain/subunit